VKSNLKIYREKKGLTQKELAKRIGVSRRTYQAYEANESTPNAYIANKLAKELDITSMKLFPI
jgi:DNA-binding XRE family transcriptional regulator